MPWEDFEAGPDEMEDDRALDEVDIVTVMMVLTGFSRSWQYVVGKRRGE